MGNEHTVPIEIPLWGRFEKTFNQTTSLRDPYASTDFYAEFTGPSGKKRFVYGFYDGENLWKIRFMPDEVGPWIFQGSFGHLGSFSGNFLCVPSDIPGPLRPFAENPFWFAYGNGKPFLMRSLHVGDLFLAQNWPESERMSFLEWFQEAGYDTLSIASFLQNRGEYGRGIGWDTPRLWPLKAEEWQALEKILDELAARRIVVYPFAGFFGREAYNPNSVRGIYTYIRYALARLSSYWNLIWNVGGPEPLLRSNPYMTRAEVLALATLIKQYDPSDHLLSVHNQTGDDEFQDDLIFDYSTLQGPKTVNRMELRKALLLNRKRLRPLYAQETLWPGNIHGHPPYTEDDIRRNSVVLLMSGASINFADHNGDSSSGFSGALRPELRNAARHDIMKAVWDFFESIPFQEIKPMDEMVSVGFCSGKKDEFYLVYFEKEMKTCLHLGEGNYKVTWIRAGNDFSCRDGGIAKGTVTLTAPTEQHWLALVQKDRCT